MNPVCVSTWHDECCKYFPDFIRTAHKHGIEPQNADPNKWAGTSWKDLEWFRKSEAQARFVSDHVRDYTHFMFTDSYDVMFAAGWAEIMAKYEKIGTDIVFAAECYPWPYPDKAHLFPPTNLRCKYLNAGMWIASAQAALHFTHRLKEEAAKREQCDQGIAVNIFLSREFHIKLDNECSIAFCCNLDSLSHLERDGERFVNKENNQRPCLFHGNGNANMTQLAEVL